MSTRPTPKALRFTRATADLLPWYEAYADAEGITLNAALLRGLTAHRAAVTRARERQAARRAATRLHIAGGASADVASL
jgi:hypothetical protein